MALSALSAWTTIRTIVLFRFKNQNPKIPVSLKLTNQANYKLMGILDFIDLIIWNR